MFDAGNLAAEIWVGGDEGELRDGNVLVEVGDNEIDVHLRVDGAIVASATFSAVGSGFLAGYLAAAAEEAVRTRT